MSTRDGVGQSPLEAATAAERRARLEGLEATERSSRLVEADLKYEAAIEAAFAAELGLLFAELFAALRRGGFGAGDAELDFAGAVALLRGARAIALRRRSAGAAFGDAFEPETGRLPGLDP